MGHNVEGGQSGGSGKADRRQSSNVNDHAGLIISLVTRWRRAGHLRNFDRDEVVNTAFIEAERLLRTKYNSERATVSTFLSRWLFGRTVYRVLVDIGQRKRMEGWIRPEQSWETKEGRTRSPRQSNRSMPDELPEMEDLIQSVHPDLRSVVRRLSEGMTIAEIIEEDNQTPLFDTRTMPEDKEEAEQELLSILQSELRWVPE